MPTRNIDLSDHLDRFVAEQVEAGRYENASEVLRAGLRLLEREARAEERKLSLLRALAADGFRSLDQGEGLSLSSEDELRSTVAGIGRRAVKSGRAD